MKLSSLFWLAVLGVALVAATSAQDIKRYLKLRSM